MVLLPLPVFEGFRPRLPHCIVACDRGAHCVLGAAPVLSQLLIPHYHVCIVSHCVVEVTR